MVADKKDLANVDAENFGSEMLDSFKIDISHQEMERIIVEARSIHTLVPIRPRSRCERRSLRTLPYVSLRPLLAFNTHPRRLSTPPNSTRRSVVRSFVPIEGSSSRPPSNVLLVRPRAVPSRPLTSRPPPPPPAARAHLPDAAGEVASRARA